MKVWLEIGGRQMRVEVPDAGAGAASSLFRVDGRSVEADARMLGRGEVSLIVEGRQFRCVLDGDAVVVAGRRYPFVVADPRSLAAQVSAAGGVAGPRAVKAPMPGRVVRVLAAVGDAVEEGQGLIVIEAMKMQNELKSPRQGQVVKIKGEIGATVVAGETLVVVE